MIAASYWSLLAPAVEMAEESALYGENGKYAFAPVAVGFLLGALFVYGTDFLISSIGIKSPHMILGECFQLFKNFYILNICCTSMSN